MNCSKILSKTAFFVTAATASVLLSSSVVAAPKDLVGAQSGTLVFANVNNRTTCARVYVNGQQYDLTKTNVQGLARNVQFGKAFMASIYNKPTCGGTAAKNVWYTTHTQATQTWLIQ